MQIRYQLVMRYWFKEMMKWHLQWLSMYLRKSKKVSISVHDYVVYCTCVVRINQEANDVRFGNTYHTLVIDNMFDNFYCETNMTF